MKVLKHRVPLYAAPRADVLGLPVPALAWADGPVVSYVWPGYLRFAHEVAHIVRGQDNAAMHHPWWHFCGLVGHAVRSQRHLTERELLGGAKLLWADDGALVDV